MATTSQQDSIINDLILEDAIEWIAGNMEPEGVFKEDELRSWAESNGYFQE